MPSLYEYNSLIYDLIENSPIDEETGEVLIDKEKLDELECEYSQKVENIACFIKDLKADVRKFKDEEINLTERRKRIENKIEKLERYLTDSLMERDIDKFESVRAKVSFRKSTSVVIDNQDEIDKEYIKQKVTETVDKTKLKEALKNGDVKGCHLEESKNIQIK